MLSDEAYVMQVDLVDEQSSDSSHITQESVIDVLNDNVSSDTLLQPSCSQNENEIPTPQTSNLNSSEAEDGQLCPICFDNWTSTGDHRICSLKCGHLFGYSCISHWLGSQKEKNCPTCKKKVSRSDIRFIYARKLIVVDNSELENMKKQLDKVTEEKNRVQIELTKAICREHAIQLKVEELQKNIDSLSKALQTKNHFVKGDQLKVENSSVVKLYMEKSLEICKESGCRVFDCFSKNDLIVASIKSPSTLFSGYGVRKINITSYKPTAYIPLHLKPIRDLKFQPNNSLLLSVSLDKTAKITDTNTSNLVCVYNSDVSLWSCCWDINNSNIVYLGQQRGSIVKLDIRKPSEPICMLEVPGDMSPVISVSSMAINPDTSPSGGVIVCQLNSLSAFKADNDQYVRHPLPVEGPFVSMSFEYDTQQLLISTRPNSQYPYSRHHLCYLENDPETGNLICRNIHCLQGSTSQKFLSRSCFLEYKSEHYVAANHESSRSVYLWNVKTGNRTCYAPAPEPVLDLCGINVSNTDFMISLTERKLMFYKFV